jgi:uncharacterized membrane protein
MKGRDIYNIIALALKAGVIGSAALLLFGMMITYSGLKKGASYGLLVESIGIFVLFSTPVTRVAMSVASFIFEGDRLYAVITAIVLMNILIAIFAVPAILHL